MSLSALALAVLICAACVQRPAEIELSTVEPSAVPSPPQGTSVGAISAEAATRAHVDPQSGRLIPRPAAAETADAAGQLPHRMSRFQGDLAEVPLAEGGYLVDLRGRFRVATVARLDENGQLQVDCVAEGGEAQSSERKSPGDPEDERVAAAGELP